MEQATQTIKPNFFIVGMPRCGTTSMYTYLKQHPEVFLALHKEPHTFSRDLNFHTIYIEDMAVYESMFHRAGAYKAIGEASVWYLTSKVAAGLIKEYNPEAKIIIMLRNPVDMLYSLHQLWVNSGNETEPNFQKAVGLVEQRMKGEAFQRETYFPEGLFYTEIGKYYDKVKRFTDIFPSEQVRIIVFDDFADDTDKAFSETCYFLGIDGDFEAELDDDKAKALIRPNVLKQLRHAHPQVRGIVKNGFRRLVKKKAKRQPLTLEFRNRLAGLFADDLEKTGRLIGHDLSHWATTK